MLTTIVLVLVIGLVVFIVGAGLMTLNHRYAVRRSNGLAKFLTVDAVKAMEDYTGHMMEKVTTEMTKWYNEMMNTVKKDED